MAIGTPLKNTPTYWSSGSGTVPWPAGAAAGQFMVAFIAGDSSGSDKREPVDAVADGWTVWNKTYSTHTWWRILDAAYLAAHPSGIAFRGRIVFLTLIPGVGAAGVRTSSAGATLSKPNAAVMMFGRGTSSLLPTAGKQFSDVQNPAYGNRRNNVWFRTETTTGYKSFSGFNGTDSDGFELIPLEGPAAPLLVSPIGGAAIDYAASNLLEVAHQSRQGATQEKIKVRIRPVAVPAGAWSYVLANGTLSAVETSVDTAAAGLSVAAGQLSAGSWEWSAATYDNGAWSDWAASETLTATTRPTATPTLTTGAGNLSPTVSWTPTVVGAQVAHQVKIVKASGGSWTTNVVYDSGVVPGAATSLEVPPRADWDNGGSYVAYLQVTQTDQLKSVPTASTAQTVSWTAPATPASCAYAPGSPPTITVTGVAAGASSLVIEASDDGGTTWRRVAEVLSPGSSVIVADPLAPYGVQSTPRARIQNTVDGVAMWSAYRTGAGFTSADLGGYFVADGSWLRVETAADSDVEPIEERVVSTGLGAEFASVDRGPRQGFRGAAAFTTLTYADELALVAWLDDRDAWTWRRPPESDGYTRVNRAPTLITAAAWKVARHISRGAWSPRVFSIDWVEQG